MDDVPDVPEHPPRPMSRSRAVLHTILFVTLLAAACISLFFLIHLSLSSHGGGGHGGGTPCGGGHGKMPTTRTACVFPSRADTASTYVIASNAPASTADADAVGWGGLLPQFRGRIFTAEGGFVGQTLLAQVVKDPHVGGVLLQAPDFLEPKEVMGWQAAATWLLQRDLAVFCLVGSVAEVTAATQLAKTVQREVPCASAPYIGLAMDIEGQTDWSATLAVMPKAAKAGGSLHTLLICDKCYSVGAAHAAEMVAAVDTIGLMLYTNVTAGALAGSPSRFQAALRCVTAPSSGKGLVDMAVEGDTWVLVGIETTWMTKAPPTAAECSWVAEDTFAAGGGLLPNTHFTAWLGAPPTPAAAAATTKPAAQAAAQAGKPKMTALTAAAVCNTTCPASLPLPPAPPAGNGTTNPSAQQVFDVAPATSPTPRLRFFVEELRPMLQLQHNLDNQPQGWPAPDASKDVAAQACLAGSRAA